MASVPGPAVEPAVNLIGYFRAESGVGEHARTLLSVLDEARVPVACILFEKTESRQDQPAPRPIRESPVFEIDLVCVNADETPRCMRELRLQEPNRRPTIGYWHWEVEAFPESMAASAVALDEVWTASRHSAEAIAARVELPVRVVPPAVDPPRSSVLPASLLPASRGPRVLTCFDFDSVFERKNPLGAIRAFRAAVPPGSGPQLVVKSINGQRHRPQLEQVLAAAADRTDIVVLDRYLTRAEQHGLIESCDVFLSLHRAEGFGLMLAEAMSASRPVVATAYSGNLEFMTEENSLLVPYRKTPVPQGAGPYRGDWAEPDHEAAVARLATSIASAETRARSGERAARDIRELHSVPARAGQLVERLRAFAPPSEASENPARRWWELATASRAMAERIAAESGRRGRLRGLFGRQPAGDPVPAWAARAEGAPALLELLRSVAEQCDLASLRAAGDRERWSALLQGSERRIERIRLREGRRS